MRRASTLLLASSLVALFAGILPTALAKGTDETVHKQSEPTTVTAKIVAIDQQHRTVTFEGHDGRKVTVTVPESVERFSALRVGDTVTARYTESVTLALAKPGERAPEPSQTEEYASAPGEMPGGTVARRVNATVTVMEVDQENGILSVEMPDGSLNSLEVQDKKRLEKLQPGDQINVTYTEALLLSVQPEEKETP